MYLEKPADYAKYAYHKPKAIPRALWPEDCKKYAVYLIMMKRHPEWKDLTEEEIEKERLKYRQEHAAKMRLKTKEKLSHMTPEEIKEFNKKKGSFYQNMTEEEKLKHNEVLRSRSNKFWNNMDDEQKKKFSQYRESKLTNSQKIKRKENGIQQLQKYMSTLTNEDILKQVKMMKEAYNYRFENDKEFREKQIALLRKHNVEYWNSLTDEQKHAIWDKNGKRLAEMHREKWKDPKYRESQIKFLQEHASDYINSLTEEELRKHSERLNENNAKYRDSMSQEEKEKFFKATILNTKFEKLFHDYKLDSTYHYAREYEVRHDIMHFKIWDYVIYNNHDDIVAVVDLDGEFNHGIECDYNGLHCAEERDAKRGFFIPENSKAYIFNAFLFEDEFKEFYNTIEMNRDEYIRFLFSKYISMKFPYPHYRIPELIYSMNRLIAMNVKNKSYRKYTNQREGDKLIYNYHLSIWKERIDGKISPYNLWNDHDKLLDELQNGSFYRDCIDHNKISQQFLLSSIAPKIPIFSAGKARILIDRYLNEYSTIFDPFSGYSGIMLGTIASMKKYIGQDETYVKIKESNQLIDFLKRSKINFPDIEIPVNIQKEFKTSKGSYECLFTYLYQNDSDDIINKCLNQFRCQKYVFVVSSTEKYKNNITEDIIYRTHFGDRYEYIIVIDNNKK